MINPKNWLSSIISIAPVGTQLDIPDMGLMVITEVGLDPVPSEDDIRAREWVERMALFHLTTGWPSDRCVDISYTQGGLA